MSGARGRWFPVASGRDLVAGHVFHALLLEEELALWRDAWGAVHAWRNRCPHRGVRLTLGENLGETLRCRYHGWRFGADGACVAVPAHPDLLPPRAARVAAFDCVEQRGLVWVRLAPGDAAPPDGTAGVPARAAVFDCDVAALRGRMLAAGLRATDPFGFDGNGVVLLLQPAAADETWVHALLTGDAAEQAHAALLERLA